MFNFTKGHYAEKIFLNSNNGTIVITIQNKSNLIDHTFFHFFIELQNCVKNSSHI
jgi:hypothetical protein